jgi:uncharacterized protein (TIGR02284 family)
MAKNIESTLDDLLRGEIAAAETYRIAVQKTDDPQLENDLRAIQQDHGDAIRFLKEQVELRGGDASDSSGPWGNVARTVTDMAAFVGDRASLSALKKGEQIGLSDYRSALELPGLPNECLQAFEEKFVPAQERHIQVLDARIEVA